MLHYIGIAISLYAAFSAVHYRYLSRDLGLAGDSLPVDIVIEVVAGFSVSLAGVLLKAGAFKPISYSAHMAQRTWEQVHDRENFRIYNHRARFLRQSLSGSTSEGAR